MKKKLVLLLAALMMITVLVVSVSCNGDSKQEATKKVTLTFDTQGGNKITALSVDAGSTVKKSKIKTPTRTGYQFLGWYTDTTYKTEATFPRKLDADMTIYAKWIDQTTYEHSDPILPQGSVKLNNNSFTIPLTWSPDADGKTGLPAVKYSFSGDRTAETNVSAELVNAVKNTPQSFFKTTPKNIIFLFSDGWGVTEVNMSREYKGELIVDSLPYATESKTDSYLKYKFDNSVSTNYSGHRTTDSCAGGTQVLAGYKTRYGYIALDVDATPVENLVEAAHRMNWKTAVVTNDNIVDATPADAMIHDTNRYHSDVLYYKALKYALAEQGLDLLMGWDWGMGRFFNNNTWAERLLAAEKAGIADALEEEYLTTKFDGKDPIAYFESLSTTDKAIYAGFSIYYHLWEKETGKLNSFMTWTTTGASDLAAFTAWLKGTGPANAAAKLAAEFADPSESVNRFTTFKSLVQNSDTTFDKPVLGSWTSDGNNYESTAPNRGYLINGSIGANYPSWPEMVAYTIYQMDKEAHAADTGFFCLIENTCTDGWGHSKNNDTKVYGMMNEVQCFDEGVAIAVKYVLEHPDTLLVVSADHETGDFVLNKGWESDFTLISSEDTGHSSQRVPLYAFGAGADKFSAEQINTKYSGNTKAGIEENGKIHEGWITGALMGELMTGAAFGQPAGYKGEAIDHGKTDDPSGNPLWSPAAVVWKKTSTN